MSTETTKKAEKGTKEGKRPVSEKVNLKEFLSTTVQDRGLLAMPNDVKRFAEKHGVRLSWRSYATIQTAGGYDPAGWTVFRREMLAKDPEFQGSGIIDGVEFEFGGHSSPVYRRGDLILGYMLEDQWKMERKNEIDLATRKSTNTKSAKALQAQVGKGIKVSEIEID